MLVLAFACGPRIPPVPPDREPFRFAVVGDRTGEPNDVAWRDVLAQVAARRPDLVLTVGDLADDALDPTDWDTALAPMASLPVEHTPGNHDILDEATARYFAERTGQAPYRSYDRGGVHFVVVDNSIAETWDALPEAQRAWLEADLAGHDLVVVTMHKPFWALGAAVAKPDPMHDLFVRSGVDVVFTGHWHVHQYQEIGGVRYVGVGTSGGEYGGVQDVRRGNAYEYAVATVRGDAIELRMVAGGQDLPPDYVTRADTQALRALRMGGVLAVARGDRIELAVRNDAAVPIGGTLVVDPGTWTVPTREVPLAIAPGETFTTSIPATPGDPPFPSPRVRLDWPLPDAGLVPYEAPVDVAREVVVPRGSATIDGRLDEWDGAPDLGPFTTALGLPSPAEPTTVHLRRDDDALYFAARCVDSDPAALQRHHAGRDGQVQYDDRIGMILRPLPDRIVWFYVNPNGAVWDLRKDPDGPVDFGWDAVEAAATVDEAGWSVEARLPFASLGLDELPETWAFDVRRKQERTQTEATFTPGFGTRDPARIGVLRLSP